MVRPHSSEHSRYRPHSLHTRIPQRPTGPQIGDITGQSAQSTASPTSPGLGSRFLGWLSGNSATPAQQAASKSDSPDADTLQLTPGYQIATHKGLLDADTLAKIEDLRTVMQTAAPKHGPLQLLVKDHLNIPPDMSHRERDRRIKELIRQGKTEFFLNLDGVENLPEDISKKYCNSDDDIDSILSDGIGFMVPTKILPKAFKPNDQNAIKSWLGLADSNVKFNLFSNRK